MLNVLTSITNWIYRVDARRRAWDEAHPQEPSVAAAAVKAVRSAASRPLERGYHWVGARRGVLLVTAERLVCGDWNLPVNSIRGAQGLQFRTLLGPGLALSVELPEAHYQFGMLPSPDLVRALPFPVAVTKGTLGTSWFSIAVRIVAVGYLLWWAARQFGGTGDS